jgi:hypothetical protein
MHPNCASYLETGSLAGVVLAVDVICAKAVFQSVSIASRF